MAITVNFGGASLRKPGSYTEESVNLTGGFPLAPTGIVGIIGEADGGAPGSSGIKTFTSEDIQSLIATYKSGPIVDAARLLVAPARDNRVPNGTSRIRVYKVNASTQATLTLQNGAATDIFDFTSANYGEEENLISVTMANGTNATLQRLITVSRGTITETLSQNAADVMIAITHTPAGTADMTIQNVSGVKTLAITGDNPISVPLVNKTIQDVIDIIHNTGGTPGAIYSATTTFPRADTTKATDLDFVSTALDLGAGTENLYRTQKELLDIVNTESSLITATQDANVEGLPASFSGKRFLQGAVRGASTNTNFQSAFDALLTTRCNTIVPLVSRDASALASEGLTDPTSSWTVDAVNLQALTHCITASNTKNRSERNCYVSKKDTFANTVTASRALNNERASMLFQDVQVLDASGNLGFKEPWAASCMIAGIQAGTSVGTPATFKVVNALGIKHTDYNAQTQIDLAIDAGLTPLEERDQGGIRCVVHNTTYGADPNFVFNRVSVLEAADFVSFNMRQQLEAIFVGGKTTSTLAVDVRDTVVAIMNTFLENQIIVGDDTNDGLGFKDLTVTVNGNVVTIDITITPVQGVDFVLNRITLDTIRQSA